MAKHDEIRANYRELDEVAGKFTNQAQAVEAMTKGLRGRMNPLESGGWQGRGSQAFFAKMNGEVLPALKRLQDALTMASQVTKEASQTIKQAEQQGASRFRR